MIPLNPSSTLTRTKQFVQEEWDTYFANNAADPASNVVGGWKGILYANLAIIDPKSSWNFFAQPNFDNSWLDGGASRTWYLAYAAGMRPSRRVACSLHSLIHPSLALGKDRRLSRLRVTFRDDTDIEAGLGGAPS